MKRGILKDGRFFIGRDIPVYPMSGEVSIVDEEDHPIFGKRYKIFGYGEWFEENCFSEVLCTK